MLRISLAPLQSPAVIWLLLLLLPVPLLRILFLALYLLPHLLLRRGLHIASVRIGYLVRCLIAARTGAGDDFVNVVGEKVFGWCETSRRKDLWNG